MSKDDINVLTGLKTAKVALVKRGANRRPRFPITKSESDAMDAEFWKAILESPAEHEDKIETILKGVDEKGAAAIIAATRVLSAFADTLPEDAIAKMAELGGLKLPIAKADNPFGDLSDDDKKKFEENAKKTSEKAAAKKAADEAKAKAAAAAGDVAKALDLLDDGTRPAVEVIVKTLQDQHLAAITKADERAAKAEALAETNAVALKIEKDAREDAEWLAKIEKEASHAPGKSSAEFAAVLKSLADNDPKLADDYFETLKASSVIVKESALLKAAGGPGGGGPVAGSAEEKIEALAKSIVQKGDGKLTEAAAWDLVIKQNPELYTQYTAEQEAQIKNRG